MSERAAVISALPWRGSTDGRPELPLPPAAMPVRLDGTWRKRWRWIGVFSDQLIISAAHVRIGPLGQAFWAILDRESGELSERTRMLLPFERGEVWTEGHAGEVWELGSDVPRARTRIESGDLAVKLHITEGGWAESICPNGEDGYVWTRKRPSEVRADIRLPDGRRIKETMRAIEDESAGYHPRHTIWSWSAGVGTATDGKPVAWNLVEGVNDPPERSERSIWVDGVAREPGPVSFDGLEGIGFEGGSRLEFAAEAERAKAENRLLVKYSYRQPFGTFSGSLDGVELAEGVGVMEHHDAHW